jgi:hypothetical protein
MYAIILELVFIGAAYLYEPGQDKEKTASSEVSRIWRIWNWNYLFLNVF